MAVSTTVLASAREAAQTVVAILLGAGVAIGLDSWAGPNAFTIAAVVSGRTNAEVATELGVSEKTVETHLHRLFDRYGVMSRTELAVLAVEERWVSGSGGGPA